MRGTWALALLLCGCEAENGGETPDTGSTGSTTAADASSSSSSTSTSTSGSTGTPSPTTAFPPSDESSSSGSAVPDGPPCSVEVTTHGLLYDPLPRGEEVGVFPPSIADALENSCGCHTLESNVQNVEHPGLHAPGGTLFTTFEDLQRPAGGSTLGRALERAIDEGGMPPGSCSFPDERAALLAKWFADGLPDGATFEPPQ